MHTLIKPQPKNLKPTESAFQLEDGSNVAICVHAIRLPNNTGVVFTVVARQIEANGEGVLDTEGRPISVSFTHTATPSDIVTLGSEKIAKEMILAVLGETVADPKIRWSPDFLSDVSIKNAMALSKAITNSAIDPKKALGLD